MPILKKSVKKLSDATRKKIESVEKLNDFFEAIDAIIKDYEVNVKDKRDSDDNEFI